MRKIKDVLRLKLDARLSHAQIAASLKISKGVVTKYVSLAAKAGLDWPTVCTLDESALEQRLGVRSARQSAYVAPDYARIHQELRKKGVTLMLLWEEYQAQYASQQTWRYTQFCERVTHANARLRFDCCGQNITYLGLGTVPMQGCAAADGGDSITLSFVFRYRFGPAYVVCRSLARLSL